MKSSRPVAAVLRDTLGGRPPSLRAYPPGAVSHATLAPALLPGLATIRFLEYPTTSSPLFLPAPNGLGTCPPAPSSARTAPPVCRRRRIPERGPGGQALGRDSSTASRSRHPGSPGAAPPTVFRRSARRCRVSASFGTAGRGRAG